MAHQARREGHLLADPQPVLQRRHRRGALRGGDALEPLQADAPVLRLLGQQRTGIERIGHVGPLGQQAVHQAARGGDRALAHVHAREVEPQPRIVRIAGERILEQAARRAEVAVRFGLPRLRGLGRTAQALEAARLRLLRGAQLRRELQRLVRAPLRGQRADQAAHRVRVVRLAPQRHPVRLLGAGRVAVLQQRVAEQHLRGDVRRVRENRALEQCLRVREVAVALRAERAARVEPVGRAVERRAPARRIAAARRTLEIAARLREALLLQRDDAAPAQRIAVVRVGVEHGVETRARRGEVATIERREAVVDRATARFVRRAAPIGLARRQIGPHHAVVARLDRRIVGRDLQVREIARLVGRPRREPQQRLTPALQRVLADLAVAGQLFEPVDAVAARRVAIGQMLRIGERVARIVRVVAREPFEAAPRIVPSARRGRERLEILALQRRRRRHALQRALILPHGLFALPALREAARIAQLGVPRTRFAQAAREFVDAREAGRGAAQLLQIAARAVEIAAIGEHHPHSEQCVGLIRIDAEHLVPRLRREIAATVRLPVAALIDEHFERVVGGLRRMRQRQRAHEARDTARAGAEPA